MVYVLVVDDEPSVREFLTRWLQGWGYAVKQAGSATEALEVMLTEPASIMLCDIKMPGHDGLWLVERVRAKSLRTAIIMATCVDDLDVVMKSQQAGVVDYVTSHSDASYCFRPSTGRTPRATSDLTAQGVCAPTSRFDGAPKPIEIVVPIVCRKFHAGRK